MNSRGTLMTHRITGDTLAISDSVAMTPTIQPAAAGTQRSRDFGWLRERDAVRVTDGEDIRSCYGMPMRGRCELLVSAAKSPGGRLILHRSLRLEFRRWRHH